MFIGISLIGVLVLNTFIDFSHTFRLCRRFNAYLKEMAKLSYVEGNFFGESNIPAANYVF